MATRLNFLFPECYVDTNIMKTLLRVDGVNHKMSCTKVLYEMRNRFADRFAVGVIDGDKRKPSGISEFHTLAKSQHLTLLKHGTRPHYLIIVSKAAEDLILSSAAELGVRVSDFDLPDNFEALKDVTKSSESDKDSRIKRLVNAISRASEMNRLLETVTFLRDNQYKVIDEELARVFNRNNDLI